MNWVWAVMKQGDPGCSDVLVELYDNELAAHEHADAENAHRETHEVEAWDLCHTYSPGGSYRTDLED